MKGAGLLFALLACSSVLLAVEFAIRSRVAGRFLPEQTFQSAVAAGNGCVATFGDSRMVAGIVASELTQELARLETPTCHAALANGGTEIVAQFLTLRRYLEQAGQKPRLIVLGMTLEATLDKHLSPDDMIGNEALVLGWSRPSDVTLVYSDFPRRQFDDGFRFLTSRALATTAYGSLIWSKVRNAQDRLVHRNPGGARNEFGAVEDMNELAAAFRQNLSDRLNAYPARVSVHPALVAVTTTARAHGVPILLVELPMPSAYAHALAALPNAERLRVELKRLTGSATGYADLSRPTWLSDAAFDDPLHLRRDAAVFFSRDLATSVARKFKAERAEGRR
jgi:hypothetical protein